MSTIYRRVVECDAENLELTLAHCYGRGAFSIEEQDLPDGRLRLLVYSYEPVDNAQPVEDSTDWQSVSEQPWNAVEIGKRLWLAPPWLDREPPAGRRRLNYIRGQGCGTGGHAATQVTLLAMDRFLKPEMSFLDVGAGSGILSRAADLLDAGAIVGCDIDHHSAVIAAQNSPGAVFTGSTRSIRSSSFDFVAANINATMLHNIGEDFHRILKPYGYLVGSGFPESEVVQLDLPIVEKLDREGWSAVVFRKPA